MFQIFGMHPRQLWEEIVDWHVPIIKFNNIQVTQFLYPEVQTFSSYTNPIFLMVYTDKQQMQLQLNYIPLFAFESLCSIAPLSCSTPWYWRGFDGSVVPYMLQSCLIRSSIARGSRMV